MKMYKSAPLPFQGQKRNFINDFSNALKQFPSDATYVDLFGGSGLLGRCVKDTHPEARVIFNDYDNFSQRLKAIPQTNMLLLNLQPIVNDYERKKALPQAVKNKLLEAIKQHENKFGFVDYITVSTWVLFSGKYATSFEALAKDKFYNRVRVSLIPTANDYLKGLEVVMHDYKELFKQFKDDENVVFLLDPPYLSTDTASYNSDSYWKLKDYLDVLQLMESKKYFYFTSNKSQIVELMEWFETTTLTSNPFKWATTTTRVNGVNHQAKYNDIMIFKNE